MARDRRMPPEGKIMARTVKAKFKLPRGRLARKIVSWVFVSVIVIETIIFIPSFNKRQKELLNHLKEISAAKVSTLLQFTPPDIGPSDLLKKLEQLKMHHTIVGGVVYAADGRRIGTFGEVPQLAYMPLEPGQMLGRLSPDGKRYDVVCLPPWRGAPYTVVLRHDTASVTAGLKAFFWRIAGLVIIISLFVTVGAWIALEPLVITPILRLRKDLVAAGEAISRDRPAPDFYSASVSRNDELGDVIDAFRQMYKRITDAIDERKKAEQALKESYEKVASYSRAMNRELEQGREMQLNFLPAELISPLGWESAAFFKPARQVSGDFYDLFELPDGSLGLVIADVCDKGVGAALFMALFRSLIRVFADEVCRAALAGTVPAEDADSGQCRLDQPTACVMSPYVLRPVERTNSYIATHHGELGMFATLFFGIMDPQTGVITYVNGGHLPLFIIAAGGGIRQRLATTGPAVGVIAGMQFEAGTARVEPGELLFGCTDGVTEASAPDGGFFGFHRLEKILEAPPVSAEQRVDELAEAVLAHTGENDLFDDITMIAMYRRP